MISPAACEVMAALCRTHAGMRIGADKPYLIESRLGPVARKDGYVSTEAYIERLRAGRDDAQILAAVAALASADTGFFRDPSVFAHLEDVVLPQLAARLPGRPVRIWSAGCATGQEVYSLAMSLADARLRPTAFELYATDFCPASLEKARAGLYSQFEVQRGLPAHRLIAHFENHGDMFAVSARLKERLSWQVANLLDDRTDLGQFDLILCRHVLDGLEPELRPTVVARLARSLAPTGLLVLSPGDHAHPGFAARGMGIFARSDGARAVG